MLQCDELKDDDRPSNTLELFTELEEILQMIDSIKPCHIAGFEKDFEHFTEILSRYQEQPHLLDPHLEKLLQNLLHKIRITANDENQLHAAFKYLYVLCKVRTHKVFVKFLPHELNDMEFVLDLLERQNAKEFKNWETRYMLILWMSILVLNPFHMARLDVYMTEESANSLNIENNLNVKTKIERICDLCKLYSETNDTCSDIAAFLSAKFFIRSDIKDIYLENFIDWVIENNQANTETAKYGQLAAVSAILKHGKREDLLPFADKLLKWIISCQYKDSSNFLKYKHYIKIVQRIGLVYLKPRIASWRYKRGHRSLATNLIQVEDTKNVQKMLGDGGDGGDRGEGEEIIVPDSIEEIIEELLEGLRSASSEIRWSAAKGIGRVTNRLSKVLADEVIGSVVDILNPLEAHESWHGACLALAELAKRGLLLPYRLKDLVPLLMQALFYDEMKSYMSVGQHIRDSACYMCWAFARAYNPSDLQPFVNEISAGLLTVSVFDREINCRRAASAAFQESVGRLGNFPHGIEISTATDFYSVGLRQNSYLNISDFIAQYNEYQIYLIDHLIDRKVGHWDSSIRELTSKALHKLTLRSPDYMADIILPKLFLKTNSIDVNTRHGSVLAIGKIVSALKQIEQSDSTKTLLTETICKDLNQLIGTFIERNLFRGMSGEIMKQCCTDFVYSCSLARINVSGECLDTWQQIVDKCILTRNMQIRDAAILALSELCKTFYNSPKRATENTEIVSKYLKGAENDLEEHIRMGYISALGALPGFMIIPQLDEIINSLIKHSLPPRGALQDLISGDQNAQQDYENVATYKWSEARRDSIKALSTLITTVGFKRDCHDSIANIIYFEGILACYLKALGEYTLDNRGDIGAWVREAAMQAIYELFTACPKDILVPEYVHQVLLGFAQQAVEKIDRTRGLAGRLFCNMIHANPGLPYIRHHELLKKIFPEDSSAVLWLFADHTFPMFCSLLELADYSKRVLLGLTASVGQLTESLIKHSSAALFNFLRSHPSEVPRLCEEIIEIFKENSLNERVTYPILNFLDILIGSGTINTVLMDDCSGFPDAIIDLVDIEVKGHKKLYKLVSGVNVLCHFIQVPRLGKKILSKMAIFLGLTHVHIRKCTAARLYEAIALYGDTSGCVPEENFEEVLNILSETDWGMPLLHIRPIRNNLCTLLEIKPPISGATMNQRKIV